LIERRCCAQIPQGSARFQRARFGILPDHFSRQDARKCTRDGRAKSSGTLLPRTIIFPG